MHVDIQTRFSPTTAHPQPRSSSCLSPSHVDGIRRACCTQRNQSCGHVAGRTSRCGARGNPFIKHTTLCCLTTTPHLIDHSGVCVGLRGSDCVVRFVAVESRCMLWSISTSMCNEDLFCVIIIVILGSTYERVEVCMRDLRSKPGQVVWGAWMLAMLQLTSLLAPHSLLPPSLFSTTHRLSSCSTYTTQIL